MKIIKLNVEQKDEKVMTSTKIINFNINPFKKILEKEIFNKIFAQLPLVIILFLALLLRIIAAGESAGAIHPDEVFQSIEMVHFRIFGKSGSGQTIPWEFKDIPPYGGARSWFFVFLLVAIYRILMFFGVTDPLELIFGARLFLSCFSMVTVLVAYFFGKEIYNKQVGLLTAFLCGTWWFFPFWASRTMTDSMASDFLFLSLYLAYKGIKREKFSGKILSNFFSGIFIGLAFMIRFQSALLVTPIVLMLVIMAIIGLIKKKKKKESKITIKDIISFFSPAIIYCFGLLIMILTQGLLDYFTWGDFLQSPINFLKYNIISGESSAHGVSPWYRYFAGFFIEYSSVFLPLFLLFFIFGLSYKEKIKTKIFLCIIMLLWFVTFSALPHKEFRFLFIILPISMIFIANGISKVMNLIQSGRGRKSFLGSFILFFLAISFTVGVIQNYPLWKINSGVCNAMYWVGKQKEVQQVIVFDSVWDTGGYAYLNVNVPCYFFEIHNQNPLYTFNSSFCQYYYQQNGTYVVVLAGEINYVKPVLQIFNLTFMVEIYGLPNTFVYAKIL